MDIDGKYMEIQPAIFIYGIFSRKSVINHILGFVFSENPSKPQLGSARYNLQKSINIKNSVGQKRKSKSCYM